MAGTAGSRPSRLVGSRHGSAGMARHGESSPGGSRLGEAWLGRHGAVRSGMAGPVVAAHGAGRARQARWGPAWRVNARRCAARLGSAGMNPHSEHSSPSSIGLEADRTTGYRREDNVMHDLVTAEDVARFLASNPAEHEHDRAIDDLADYHGTREAVVVWRHGVRLHEQRQVAS